MGGNIDAKALLDACMADLGRERQEELPLSKKAIRGPTFLPTGRNGVGHLSSQLRKKLSRGWNAKIDDGESQQMEGLDIEDSRPWAKQRNGTARNKSSLKPTTLQQNAGTSKLRDHPAGVLASIPKRAFATQHQQSKKEETPTEIDADINDETQQYTLLRGPCEILNGVTRTGTPSAEFVLRANLKTNRGFLAVKPYSGIDIVWDVLDLEYPIVNGTMCTIACQKTKGAFTHALGFQKTDEAQHFHHYLKSLQDSAARNTKTPFQTSESLSSSLTDSGKSHGSSIDDAMASLAISPPQDTINEQINAEPVENLIEFDEAPSSDELDVKPIYGGSFEDTASLLFDIIQKILTCIKGPISKEIMQNVEETVLKNWVGMTPMDDDDDIMDDLHAFLRSAINIKIKRDTRQRKMNLQVPAVAALQNDLASTKAVDRIQYTATEMLHYRTCQNQKTRLQGLGDSRWAKPSSTLNAEAPAYEPLMSSDSQAPGVASVSQNPELGQPIQPGAKGLSASRWADKPVAFEGRFTGIESK